MSSEGGRRRNKGKNLSDKEKEEEPNSSSSFIKATRVYRHSHAAAANPKLMDIRLTSG